MKKALFLKAALIMAALAVAFSALCAPPFPAAADGAGGDTGAGSDEYELPYVPIETEHQWDNGVITTPATCTQPGIKTFSCKINSSHTYTAEIPAKGHRPFEPVIENEIPATCCANGSYDEVLYCAACGAEISRTVRVIGIDENAHSWGEWEQTQAPTETEPGTETRVCTRDPRHTETREIPALPPAFRELSFLEGEVIITVPAGAIPEGAEFIVQKIVPPPEDAVSRVKSEKSSNANVTGYYTVRLFEDGIAITRLNGQITVKLKMPAGKLRGKVLQEDQNGNLVEMPSRFEGEYLCYDTDWLEN